jgi:hypothetical protein
MEHPALLSEKTLPALKQLTEDFPYFPAVRMLYLKNLALTEELRLQTDLKKMAIYVPDRLKLFLLLEGDRYRHPFAPEPETKKTNGQFDLVDKFLLDKGFTGDYTSGMTAFAPASSTDYTYWLLTKNTQKEDDPGAKLNRQDLIDSFLENGDIRLERRPLTEPSVTVGNAENESDSTASKTPKNVSPEMSYFTETLAYIYIRQRRYEKALEIIKSLSLKYPEKNIYFAAQIRFLEKLIIYTKS